jgi:hypothetical protein
MSELSQYLPRRGRTPTNLRVNLRAHQFKRLESAAARRNVSPLELATSIVKTVLDHNLINAVLDDDADHPAAGVPSAG